MNNERFLRLLNSGKQVDFYQLVTEIQQYAAFKAQGLPDDTDDKVWYKIEDLLIAGRSFNSWPFVKTIIDNYIKDLRKAQKVKAIDISAHDIAHFVDIYEEPGEYAEYENPIRGWQGFILEDKHGYPKDNIRELPDGKEREICLLYWQSNKKQSEIAIELKVSKAYVSKIVKRHKRVS